MGAVSDDYKPLGDFWHNAAIRQIYGDYGDMVSILSKNKALSKFGRTDNTVSSTKVTIGGFPDTINNETLETTNVIDAVISTSASDTETLVIEGHTIDANGLLTFAIQDVVLTGQTKAALTTPLARATRAYVKNGTFASPASDLVGRVSIYDDTGGQSAGGVPNTDSAVKLQIRGDLGRNQSEKCATAISNNDYWLIREAHCAIASNAAGTVNADIEIEIKQLGGVWRPVGIEASLRAGSQSFTTIDLYPIIVVPPNSDVRMVVTATANDVSASGRMEGLLAKKV